MRIAFLILGWCVLLSCAGGNKAQTTNEKAIPETSTELYTEKKEEIWLGENGINGLELPFARKEMLEEIKAAFDGYEVTKEIGQQDGPDFPLYSVKKDGQELLFFSMNWEDTLKLDRILIKSSLVVDEYGLAVGEDYGEIESNREALVQTFTNYHQHTYAYTEGSNIIYEISGEVDFNPDTVDFENIKFTREQVKGWTIDYLIWRESPSQ